jgi:hypothetical protein
MQEYRELYRLRNSPANLETRMVRDFVRLGIPEDIARYHVSKFVPIPKITVGNRTCSH